MHNFQTEIKKILDVVRWVLIILAVFLGIWAVLGLKNLQYPNPSFSTISVTGEGEVVAVPDIAAFSFTVSADAKEVSAAQKQVTEKMDSIVAGLKEMGIEEKDIKTSDYSIYPKYSYAPTACSLGYCPPGKQVNDGYSASHNVTVKVRKTEEAGKALGLVGEKGATNISSLSFTVDDPEKIVEEARQLAIKEAKTKADTLRKNLGVRLGKVINFSDSTRGGMPIPLYERAGYGGDATISSQIAPTIPIGENKVVVQVYITYEIK